MGFIIDVLAASPLVTKYEQGARWSKGFRAGGQEARETMGAGIEDVDA